MPREWNGKRRGVYKKFHYKVTDVVSIIYDGEKSGPSKNCVALATVAVRRGSGINGDVNPAQQIANAINTALDPTKCNGKCRTLADMSDEEIAKLEAQYGCAIKRPIRDEHAEDCEGARDDGMEEEVADV